jgi:hypothetical protein
LGKLRGKQLISRGINEFGLRRAQEGITRKIFAEKKAGNFKREASEFLLDWWPPEQTPV